MIDTVDYSLNKKASKKAKEKGLVDADWYLPPISKKDIRKLLERRDKPAIFDSILWSWNRYLWVSTDNYCIAVMTCMTPAPRYWEAIDHKR